MSVNDLLTEVAQGTLILLALLALVDFLRHRDRERLDLTLLFGALASVILIQGFLQLSAQSILWLSTLGAMLLLAQPYLLLRLVRHFRPVSRRLERLALIGMAVSWLLLLVFPAAMPAAFSMFIVACFVLGEACAAWAFARGALASARATEGLQTPLAERAQAALRRSEEKYSKVFSASPHGIIINSLQDGRVIDVNDSYLRILGRRRDEIVVPPPAAGVSEQVAERNRLIGQLLSDGLVHDVETGVRGASGEWVHLLASGERIELDGEPAGLTFLYDITARKQAEEAVQRLNASSARQSASLEAANKELEAFSYSVSHDLRAPLRAIDGFSRILERDHSPELSEVARGHVEFIRINATRMGDLIDDLLRLSRVNRTSLTRQAVDMTALVRQTLAELQTEQGGGTSALASRSSAFARPTRRS